MEQNMMTNEEIEMVRNTVTVLVGGCAMYANRLGRDVISGAIDGMFVTLARDLKLASGDVSPDWTICFNDAVDAIVGGNARIEQMIALVHAWVACNR